MAATLKQIVPHLWYGREAKKAAAFYVSVFPGSKITGNTTIKDPSGAACDIVNFKLSGKPFVAISAGHLFKFNESISFIVYCDTQQEIDYYWKKLTAGGGKQQPCGWLKDKFGLSWQITYKTLETKMLKSNNPQQLERVTKALWQMKKINIAKLQKAFKG